MRVCIIGIYRPDYPRCAVIQAGLTAVGIEVEVRPIPENARTPGRVLSLLRQYPLREPFDLVLIPPFNQVIAPAAWLLSQIVRKPLLVDYLVGLSDVNEDRGTARGWRAVVMRWVDRFNISQLHTMTDTAQHRDVFGRLLGVNPRKMAILPVGTLDSPPLPDPPSDSEAGSGEAMLVQYVGTYIPFHGVQVILQAADLLRADRRIRFELIGSGQTFAASTALAESLGLENVSFRHGYFESAELRSMMARSTLMLGVFGESSKTAYVVPNKVFDGVGAGRVVITAESPAVAACFQPGEHLITVTPDDPQSLADAIRDLADNPQKRARIASAGRQRIEAEFLPRQIGSQLKDIMMPLIKPRKKSFAARLKSGPFGQGLVSVRNRLFDSRYWSQSREEFLAGLSQISSIEGALDWVWRYNGAGHYKYIRPDQDRAELAALTDRVQRLSPKVIVEIGTRNGGTLFMWSQCADEVELLVSIDLPEGIHGGGYPEARTRLYQLFTHNRPSCRLELWRSDSQTESTRDRLKTLLAGRPIDFLFIDGDHRYTGVKRDFELYSGLVRAGGLIAFHDIRPNPRDATIEVYRLWDEIKGSYPAEELIREPYQGRYGIGVITMP